MDWLFSISEGMKTLAPELFQDVVKIKRKDQNAVCSVPGESGG